MADSKRTPWMGRFLRNFVLLYLAVALVWLSYAYIEREARAQREQSRSVLAVQLAQRTLVDTLKHVRGDVTMLANADVLANYFRDQSDAHREQVTQAFVRLAEVRGTYAQVRLLDADGHERVRVNAQHGRVSVVKPGQLQDKSQRDYVRAVAALPRGDVYVSPLELNVEHGRIQQPPTPTLRVGAGVFDAAGRRLGMVVINVDGRHVIAQLDQDQHVASAPLWLASANGAWLIGPDRSQDWVQQLHPQASAGIASRFPDAWARMKSGTHGQINGSYGFLTYANVTLGSPASGADAPMLRLVNVVPAPALGWLPLGRYWPLYLLIVAMLVAVSAWIARQQSQLRQQRAEAEINSRLMNDLFRHSPLMMKVKDLNGRIQRINESGARMIGRPADELIGQGVGAVATPATVETIAAHDREVIRGSRVSQYEERVDYIGGSYTLLTTRFPVTDAHGRVVGVGAVSTDITARSQFEESLKLAKAQAESANTAKSAFLSNMSHELRTPLNSIIGLSELLMEDLQDAGVPEHNESLRRVIQAGRHLLYLINDLLDMARVETGRLELCMEPTLVQEVVDAVEGTVRPLAAANGNQLTLDVEPGIRWVHADPNRLRQILLNLLGNAAKFTRHGRIHLRVGHAGKGREEQIAFVVSDDGIGMSAEQIEHIFEPFIQADETIGRRFGGTGLGLTITRQLVELMGGDISVDSAPNQGSTFTVRLPAARADGLVAAPTASVASLGGGRSTVLVVDDDADARSILAATLERDGLRVLTAANGAEALRLTQRELPDLMVLDIELPDMSGWELLSRVREDPRHTLLPVILCTVTDRDQRVASLGVAEYFSKPLDRERLLTVVHRFLGADAGAVIGIVDDDEGYRRVMAETLSRAGYGVLEAASGPAILELLDRRRCDLLLLDVVLPGMDGLEVLQRLRDDPRTLNLEVVLITAADLSSSLVERIRQCAVTLVHKQAESPEALVRRVHETLLNTDAGVPKN